MREVEKNKKFQNNKKAHQRCIELARTVHSTIARSCCTFERKVVHRRTKFGVLSTSKYSLWTEEATIGAHTSLDYCTQTSAAVQRAPERRILSA